ncbi:hypothetical protein [Streptomyces violens]|uniref:hypothetical protein n=1 Tax=Streptomyces violens TaxID=66377 RepID=UPI000A56E4F7|nr:hypothetical protein [Streptomyces violens]
MSEQYAHPQPDDPRAQGYAQPPAAAPQTLAAQHAWVAGYQPGNPWQAQLCMQTPYGTVAYPLTPHTMPELLESLVLVAQEQQGVPAGLDASPGAAEHTEGPDEDSEDATMHNGRAARLTGWALVHDLWERDDPTARIVMGAVVVALLVLGVFLA